MKTARRDAPEDRHHHMRRALRGGGEDPMKLRKRFFAVLLTLCLLAACLPIGAAAAYETSYGAELTGAAAEYYAALFDYYVTKGGLKSIDLDTEFTFKLHQISTGKDTVVSCSALSWAYDYQNDAERGLMCKALYLYSVAADANF